MPGFQLLCDANAMRPRNAAGAPPPLMFNVIVATGDSITSGSPSTPNGSYAYRYDDYRTDKTVEVRAQGSRVIGTTANLNDDGNSLMGNVSEDLAYDPQLVTVGMIGANDLAGGVTSAGYRTNMTAYKAQITATGAKLAWGLPLAYNPTGTPHPNYALFMSRRAELLADCRNPAVWGTWANYYIPMGEHPDFADVSLAAPLFGDSVHPSSAGQSLLFGVYKAAMDTILDTARRSATAPYAAVWPVSESSLAANSMVTRRFLLSGLNPSSPHGMNVTGAELRLNGGPWVTSLARVYNGDVIDVRKTSSATASASVMYSLTIGSETRVITLTTVAAVDPVVYTHGGILTDPSASTTKTFSAVPFGAGLAVVAITSQSSYASAVTIGGNTATLVHQQARTGNRGFQVYTCLVASAANLNVVITRGASSTHHVMSFGTLTNADPTPVQATGSAPASVASPHATPALGVPANGIALGWLMEEGGATITPATSVVTPSVFIAEGNVVHLSSTAGLAMAKRSDSGTIVFNFVFGSFARAGVVFKALGT